MTYLDATQPLYNVLVECYEFIDDGFPPVVMARLMDVDGKEWLFREKTPTFFAGDDPTISTPMPVPGQGRCEILRTDGDVVLVRMEADDVEEGVNEFRIRPEQIAGRWNA